MASSASRSRIFPARPQRSYRLEMESRTLYLLLSLIVLTGVVVFYLGVVTGKALRDPNAPVPLSAEMRAPVGESASDVPQGGLALTDALKAQDGTIEGLRVEQEGMARRTQALLNRAQKQLELQEVTPREQAKHEPAAAPASPLATGAPTLPESPRMKPPAPAAAAPQQDDGLYTVQVFSSQRQDNARALMNRLNQMGFAAYLNRFQAADKQVWYRVRVGRTSRGEAEALSARLKAKANLTDPQVRKL